MSSSSAAMLRVRGFLDDTFKLPLPAITSGLCIFLVIIQLIKEPLQLEEAWRLDSTALTEIKPSKLTMYPLVHLNWFHLLLNIWALFPVLKAFEMENGTVRTGVVLNVWAVVCGVTYAVLDLILPLPSVVGASGWVFALLGYFAWLQFLASPTIQITETVSLPTWSPPVILLVVTSFLLPSSSFLGHALGLVAGFALGTGYLDRLVEPTSGPIQWIERHLNSAIDLLPPFLVCFVKEVNAKEFRQRGGSFQTLPTTEPTEPTTVSFAGAGQRLGD